MEKNILTVLVGSKAHKLDTPDSDTDKRAVYITPTKEMFKLGYKYQGTHWIEGEKEDQTSYEIAHFLSLASHSNPTILELFLAPIIEATDEGLALRELFPYVWNSVDAFNAFTGYGINQQKKYLQDKDTRPLKYATAYIRVLYNLNELLDKGTFTIALGDIEIGNTLRKIKRGEMSKGEVIDLALKLEMSAKELLKTKPVKITNFDKINEFLVKIRMNNL